MSSLSWLMYLIGVSTTISHFFGFVIAIFLVLSIALSITHLVLVFNSNDRDILPVAERHGRSVRRWTIAAWVGLFASITIQFIVPSRQTALMIAAAEIHQQAVVIAQMQARGDSPPALDPSIDFLNLLINNEVVYQQRIADSIVDQSNNGGRDDHGGDRKSDDRRKEQSN